MKKLILSLLAACSLATPAVAKDEIISERYNTSEARLLDFVPEVQPLPLTVKIKVIGKRIHETYNLTAEELAARSYDTYEGTLNNLRSYAVFIASGKYDCDLIVGARFNFVITRNEGAAIEMFGYPANFVNWGGDETKLDNAPVVNPNYEEEMKKIKK